MTKLIKMAAVVGFAALSVFAANAMTSVAGAGDATHWSVNAGDAR